MNQLNFAAFQKGPPPRRSGEKFLILQKLTDAYKLWHTYFGKLPRVSRHTLGKKIDALFTDCIETTLAVSSSYGNERGQHLKQTSQILDRIKYFVTLAWEMQALNHKQYAAISFRLEEIGKMLGGLLKKYMAETKSG